MKRRTKLIIVGVISFVICIVFAIFVGSIFAVSKFRSDANQQFNPIISDSKTGVAKPVELVGVPLAGLLNSTYKRVKTAQPAYQKLLNDARKYNLIKQCQNQLTELYNAHLSDDAPLTGGALDSAETCLATVIANYPNAKSVANDLRNLVTLVEDSTTFSQIESQLSTVINDQATWLNQLETELNAESVSFQKAVN